MSMLPCLFISICIKYLYGNLAGEIFKKAQGTCIFMYLLLGNQVKTEASSTCNACTRLRLRAHTQALANKVEPQLLLLIVV